VLSARGNRKSIPDTQCGEVRKSAVLVKNYLNLGFTENGFAPEGHSEVESNSVVHNGPDLRFDGDIGTLRRVDEDGPGESNAVINDATLGLEKLEYGLNGKAQSSTCRGRERPGRPTDWAMSSR